jgi:hypothetical protein
MCAGDQSPPSRDGELDRELEREFDRELPRELVALPVAGAVSE